MTSGRQWRFILLVRIRIIEKVESSTIPERHLGCTVILNVGSSTKLTRLLTSTVYLFSRFYVFVVSHSYMCTGTYITLPIDMMEEQVNQMLKELNATYKVMSAAVVSKEGVNFETLWKTYHQVLRRSSVRPCGRLISRRNTSPSLDSGDMSG